MDTEFTTLLDLVQTFGTWMIFLWLFVQERTSHEETRKEYREDLRDIAGLRARLNQADHE